VEELADNYWSACLTQNDLHPGQNLFHLNRPQLITDQSGCGCPYWQCGNVTAIMKVSNFSDGVIKSLPLIIGSKAPMPTGCALEGTRGLYSMSVKASVAQAAMIETGFFPRFHN
jgi:hypothetical protein